MKSGDLLGVVKDARRSKELELRRNGFEILREWQAAKLLAGKTTARPDLIARRGEEVVIIEFARRQPNSSLPEEVKRSLVELSALADSQNNWNFEMVWIGEGSAIAEEQVVDSFAQRAVLVANHDQAAGILLAYAALEGAISRLVERTPELQEQSKRRLRVGLGELASLGLLSPDDFHRLNMARQVRNSIAHGIETPVSLSMIKDVARMAERIADARYVSVDQMVDWFLENYEDPANGVPYDSSEGGFQYVLGGPYDATDVLSNQFPDASAEDIDEAARSVESEAHEWVKKGVY